MTGASIRPPRGALLTVSLSRAESTEWSDAAFRDGLVKDVAKRARAKGRRYFEIYNSAGVSLHVGESS